VTAAPLATDLWNCAAVAKHLQISRTQFYRRRPELEAHGFPRPVPTTRLYQPLAIVAWEVEQSTGRRLDGVALLEAAGMSNVSTTRILAARADQLADKAERIAR